VDNGYLYIAGHNSSLFAVEKRLASTGAVDTTFDSDGYVISSAIGYALGLAVDGGAIYLAGDTGANGDWHIEKRDKVYGALCSGTICGGVAFDTDGMIDLTGNLYSELHDIAIDGTYMYLAGEYFYHTGGFPGTNWDGSVLEKRLLTTGAVDTGFGGGDGNKIDDFTTEATAIEIDGTYMYVAGHDATYNWRARKFSLSDGTFQCIGFGINGTIPRDIAIDSSSMYVSGQNGPVAGSNELILEKRNLSDCELVILLALLMTGGL
jgi:hypothetical protein